MAGITEGLIDKLETETDLDSRFAMISQLGSTAMQLEIGASHIYHTLSKSGEFKASPDYYILVEPKSTNPLLVEVQDPGYETPKFRPVTGDQILKHTISFYGSRSFTGGIIETDALKQEIWVYNLSRTARAQYNALSQILLLPRDAQTSGLG